MGVWVTFSPKPLKNWQKIYKPILEGPVSLVNEIKVVLGTISPDLLRTCEKLLITAPDVYLFMQPKADTKGKQFQNVSFCSNLVRVINFVVNNPKWRMSFQLQKLVGLE